MTWSRTNGTSGRGRRLMPPRGRDRGACRLRNWQTRRRFLDWSTPFTVGGVALGAIIVGGSGNLIAAHKNNKDAYTFEGSHRRESAIPGHFRLNACVPDYR
ncbi:MAG: hypothetical protein MZV64_11085 [Ignavibacteriales bacterium]|nr:hypothetical protein [Ignavibacteriales bacterium]